MDRAVLVKTEREIGWELLENLEVGKYPVEGAFWQYLYEAEDWRLFLVTPLVDKEGTLIAYRHLSEQLSQMSQEIQETLSPAYNITVLRSSDERVKQLRKKYGKIEKDHTRFRSSSLGLNETYIYFL